VVGDAPVARDDLINNIALVDSSGTPATENPSERFAPTERYCGIYTLNASLNVQKWATYTDKDSWRREFQS
jgi:hypothetical protein